MASGSDITLYWGEGSPPCWSILVVLEEKNLEYDNKLLSFNKHDHKSAEMLRINPRGQLPCCKIGDMVINECMAVCMYLEEEYQSQGTSFMPSTPKARAPIWQKLSEFNWNFPRKCYLNYVRHLWYTAPEKRDPVRVAESKAECLQELDHWDAHLRAKGDTKYLVGDSFTLLDVIAFPWIAFFVALGLQLRPRFENLAAYYDEMKERPSIKKHWPKVWDGSVNKEVLKDLY